MKYTLVIFFLCILLLTNSVMALTINSGVVLNTTSSNTSITFSFNINVTNFTVEPNYILIYEITFANNTGTYTCSDVNHSVPNSNIDSSDFNCILQTQLQTQASSGSGGGHRTVVPRHTVVPRPVSSVSQSTTQPEVQTPASTFDTSQSDQITALNNKILALQQQLLIASDTNKQIQDQIYTLQKEIAANSQQVSKSTSWLSYVLMILGLLVLTILLLLIRSPRRSSSASQPAQQAYQQDFSEAANVNPDLAKYVRTSREAGFNDSDIRQKLISSGWSSSDINAALQ